MGSMDLASSEMDCSTTATSGNLNMSSSMEHEMPAMVPISIRSTIPELQSYVDARVLACVDLTWKEYLVMFNVELDFDNQKYVVRGSGSRQYTLDSKVTYENGLFDRPFFLKLIGDHINSFKRKPKAYQVSIEKVHGKMKSKPLQLPITSCGTGTTDNGQYNGNGDLTTVQAAGAENMQELEMNSSDDKAIIVQNPGPDRCSKSAAQPNLKPSVIQFLVNKVSNKDMLKVREELMKLKNHDDYFKVTSLTPLAAGLLDQMLCRDVNTQQKS